MLKDKKKKITLSKEDKKNITRCSILLFASLANLTAASLAWFTFNKENEIKESRFESSAVPFELAASGSPGLYDHLLGNMADEGTDIKKIFEDDITDDSGNIVESGTITYNRQTIRWLMTSENNFNNLEKGYNRDILFPGCYGSLEFYIIPVQNGDLNVKLSLDIDIYDYRQPDGKNSVLDDSYRFEDSQRIQQLLSGHIMFFKSRTVKDDGSYRYSDIIEYDSETNPGFIKELQGAEKDKAYKTTIYWVWPDLMGQLVLPENNPILDSMHPVIFGDDAEKDTFIEELKDKPEKYFHGYSDSDKRIEKAHEGTEDDQSDIKISELFNSETFSETIDRITECDFLYSDPNNDYSRLSYYWNNADQYIGVSASYITAELSAFADKRD